MPGPLAVGQLLPEFSLLSSESEPVRASDYRGRCNLVIVFAGDCSDTTQLKTLADSYPALQGEEAEVLLVAETSVEAARRLKSTCRLPFPVMVDESGRVRELYGRRSDDEGDAPAVVIADRYGEVWRTSAEDAKLASPSGVEEILGWLAFINSQCPE